MKLDSIKITIGVKEMENGQSEFTISTPNEQENLDIITTALIFSGAIGMLVKTCNNVDLGIKDYELLEICLDNIKEHFKSVTSFEEAGKGMYGKKKR